MLNHCAFDACWNGLADSGAVTIRPQGEVPAEGLATSLFGQGIITFHIPRYFSYATRVEFVDRRLAEPTQGCHLSADRRGRDRLVAVLAWWHQVRSIDFRVTVTYTNFRWPNDGFANYPAG